MLFSGVYLGMLVYTSYRDPNVAKTIDNFDEASEFLANVELNQDSLTKVITYHRYC